MEKTLWEYCTCSSDDGKKLNELGNEGWEAFCVNKENQILLKRSKGVYSVTQWDFIQEFSEDKALKLCEEGWEPFACNDMGYALRRPVRRLIYKTDK